MGCGYTAYCHDCKVEVYLGYGSYGTWTIPRDGATVEDFQKELSEEQARCNTDPLRGHVRLGSLRKNQNCRKFIGRHNGHNTGFYSEDYTTRRDDGSIWFEEGWVEPYKIVPAGYTKENWDVP